MSDIKIGSEVRQIGGELKAVVRDIDDSTRTALLEVVDEIDLGNTICLSLDQIELYDKA